MEIKKKKKGFLIASIVVGIFSLCWFLGAVGFWNVYAPIKEIDTKEFTVEIKSIDPINIFTIKTDAFKANLFIFFKDSVLDMDALNQLSVGQNITIKVKSSDVSSLANENESIEIVS